MSTTTLPKPLRLIGAVGSPYSRKMLSLLRYRRIPHSITWNGNANQVLDEMGIDKPKFAFLPTFLLPNSDGGLEAVCDSTPIIHRLEQEQAERSAIPSDPALAFINFLLEDYADEWCTKFMFHYRWHFETDADNAATMLALTMDPGIEESSLQQFKSFFKERQVSRLGFVGSNDTTSPIIETAYQRLLTLLDAHWQQMPFLLGNKPSSSDFALFGQLSQLVGFDPTPRRLAYECAPRTVGWVNLMEDHSALEAEQLEWQAWGSLPSTLTDLLTEVGRTYVPALLANAQALKAGEKQWKTEIDGAIWTQQSFPYQGKCLQWIGEQYQQLSSDEQQRVTTLLQGTGCEPLLTLTAR